MTAGAVAIGVYYADTRNVGTADIDALVTDDDRGRLTAITRRSRRTQYLAGRALLRFALQQWTGVPAALHRLTARVGGKPECVGGPMISVAHDGTLVVCAIAPTGEVGVDVQFPAARRRTEDIAREYFSAAECAWLRGAPDEAFYALWVLKEAYLKSLGHGLAGGLASLDCRIEPPRIEATAAVPAELALYALGGAHLGVAAVGCGVSNATVEGWSPSPASAVPLPRLVATTASA